MESEFQSASSLGTGVSEESLFQNLQESQASWVDHWNLAMCQLGRVGLGPPLWFHLLPQLLVAFVC